MQREIDMASYEEIFTKLERAFFERTSAMNIVAYVADRQFTEGQYQKIYDHYLETCKIYNECIREFENNVVIVECKEPVNWKADFERRVIYVTPL